MGKQYYDRYMPIEVHTIKVDATQASAKKVVFDLPYMVTGAIAQVRASNGAINDKLESVVIAQDNTTKAVTAEVTIASTGTLAENSIVSLLAFK